MHTAATSTDSAPPRPGAGARGIRLSRSASQLRRPGWHDLLDEPTYDPRRLTELGDGRLAYRTRYPLRGGATHRIMEPLELMARLAAVVAPPRHPLVRYFGVLSSHSAWRSEVVARPPSTNGKKRRPKQTDDANSDNEPASAAAPSSPVASRVASPSTAHTRPSAVTEPDSVEPTVTVRTQAEPRPKLQRLEPFNVITAQHLERLLDGRLLATGPRLTWAQLLQRTYAIDLGTCPRCGGRMKPIAQIHDPAVIRRILDHLDDKPAAGHPAPRGPPRH
ncbi:MAG: transposase [Deltaproteobacteria bacterium]|nr:transposase [Deltaproteobacteria bacterium]